MVTEKDVSPQGAAEAPGDELEALRREQASLVRELASRDAVIIRLEQAAAGKESELTGLKQALAEAERKVAGLNGSLAEAVLRYQQMVVEQNPGIPPELISGDSLDAVDRSLRTARALVERVRGEMEAEVARTRVPAGAPQRRPPDLSALSAREKIHYAVGGHQ